MEVLLILFITLELIDHVVVPLVKGLVLLFPVIADHGSSLVTIKVVDGSGIGVQLRHRFTSWVRAILVDLHGVRKVHLDILVLRGRTLGVKHLDHFSPSAFLGELRLLSAFLIEIRAAPAGVHHAAVVPEVRTKRRLEGLE